MLAREAHAAVELVDACGLEVGGRQVKEVDSRGSEALFVVPVLLPQIDDRANAMVSGEVLCAIDRKASANRELLRQPMEVGRPGWRFSRHTIFFIFFFGCIFFFILTQDRYCCLLPITVVGAIREWNNKASQLFRAHMLFHSKSEPIRE
jgi:hypothetical protein